MPKPKRKVSAPATTRRPKTRRDAALPHYHEAADVPASVFNQVAAMRRCIIAKDGKPVGNTRNWAEIDRKSISAPADGHMSFRTEDGRHWRVTVEETNG